MKFIDEAIIELKAGDGGKGCVSFRREKWVPRGGPDGGNGGRGGDIIFTVSAGMTTLMDFRYTRRFEAGRGEHGQGSGRDGRGGEERVIPVPPGTVVYSASTHEMIADLTEAGQRTVIAKAGRGGRGNAFFATSTQQAPRFAQEGEPGESLIVRLELKLIADVGLIGLPNAGKSTFLSVVSKARPKIADYPFTTLSPCLGVVKYKDTQPFVIADLPGLIEGANAGKGMGDKFLKHCERTRMYLHLVSLSPAESLEPFKRFRLIEKELSGYDPAFRKKKKLVLLTQCELADAGDVRKHIAVFRRRRVRVLAVSAVTGENVDRVLEEVITVLAPSSRQSPNGF